jgi:hypothetical protein
VWSFLKECTMPVLRLHYVEVNAHTTRRYTVPKHEADLIRAVWAREDAQGKVKVTQLNEVYHPGDHERPRDSRIDETAKDTWDRLTSNLHFGKQAEAILGSVIMLGRMIEMDERDTQVYLRGEADNTAQQLAESDARNEKAQIAWEAAEKIKLKKKAALDATVKVEREEQEKQIRAEAEREERASRGQVTSLPDPRADVPAPTKAKGKTGRKPKA